MKKLKAVLKLSKADKVIIFRRDDLILAILGATETRIRSQKKVSGMTRLEQLIQLFQKELGIADLKKIQIKIVNPYDFSLHKEFVNEFKNDLQTLVNRGFIQVQKEYRGEHDYSLTSIGEKWFQEQKYPSNILRILNKTKRWNRTQPDILKEYLQLIIN